MTDNKTTEKEVKELPDLTDISTQDWFKTAYDAHTSDEYRSLLDEKNVAYLASDNKNALTYRYLEATNGLQNDSKADPVTEKTAEVTNQTTTQTTPKAETNTKITTAQSPVSSTPVNDNSEIKAVPATNVKTPAKTDAKATPKAETISVKNNLGRDVLESATGTRLIAGKTTKITPTVKVSRERIISNLKQLNALNGNQLTFEE